MNWSVLLLVVCLLLSGISYAAEYQVTTNGSCAIAGVTAEEAQTLALRRARSAAVEQAAGVSVTSSALVTDGKLAGDFIKTFSHGYIVDESVTWEPVGQYQPDPAKPPVIEYRVRLEATVFVPDGKRPRLGLQAELNQHIFRADKDKLGIQITTAAPARLAVFNITADDRVVMLYPEASGGALKTANGSRVVLPDPKNGGSLLMSTLKGHKRDTEALLVAALSDDADHQWAGSFIEGRSMPLAAFFERYAVLASHCEDVILPYEVFSE